MCPGRLADPGRRSFDLIRVRVDSVSVSQVEWIWHDKVYDLVNKEISERY